MAGLNELVLSSESDSDGGKKKINELCLFVYHQNEIYMGKRVHEKKTNPR